MISNAEIVRVDTSARQRWMSASTRGDPLSGMFRPCRCAAATAAAVSPSNGNVPWNARWISTPNAKTSDAADARSPASTSGAWYRALLAWIQCDCGSWSMPIAGGRSRALSREPSSSITTCWALTLLWTRPASWIPATPRATWSIAPIERCGGILPRPKISWSVSPWTISEMA